MFLPWFFHRDLLLQMEIPGLRHRVLSEVQPRHSVLLPPVWLLHPAPLWFRCWGIPSLQVCLSWSALLLLSGLPPHRHGREATALHERSLESRVDSAIFSRPVTLSAPVFLPQPVECLSQEVRRPGPVSQPRQPGLLLDP